MLDNIAILVDAPIFLVQLVLDGLLLGAVFALAAYGMALVWGVMNIINVAQGEFVMLGGFVTVVLYEAGYHPFLGIPAAAVLLFALGWLLYHGFIFRIVERDMFVSLLATFGLSIVLQQLMNEFFGSDVQTADSGWNPWFWGLITVSSVKLAACVLALVLGLSLALFLRRTRTGQTIRATAQNAQAAKVLGINIDRVYALTYGLNAAICGTAGALVAMAYTIHPYIGLPYTVRSFMIVVAAGLGNVAGVIAAGLGLGAAENLSGFILGAEYQLAFVFGLMVVLLVVRNTLLMRKRQYLK